MKKSIENLNFILKHKDWIKLWDFYFSIWFLDRVIETHIKHNNQLGYENKNTLHVFENGKEVAFFLDNEIKQLERARKRKLLSKEYMDKHYNNAKKTIKQIGAFFKVTDKNSDIIGRFSEYSNLLEKLLSFYRASRPEVFEIIEGQINKSKNLRQKRYLKSLILKYGKLRLDIKKAWLNAEKNARKIKAKIGKKFNLNVERLEYLTTKEIINLFKRKLPLKIAKNLIKERKFCIFGLLNNEKILITGREAKIIAQHLLPRIKKTNEITGKVAYPGRAQGRIRLIPQVNYREMISKAKQFKKGEILVTGMTQPDIIMACKKAKAIITDEGGITSHAAIISRELKIPCIIGTKIATKVLKDGDMVEVDANNGIIKILKK